jgi:hypothetical protein
VLRSQVPVDGGAADAERRRDLVDVLPRGECGRCPPATPGVQAAYTGDLARATMLDDDTRVGRPAAAPVAAAAGLPSDYRAGRPYAGRRAG